MEASLTPKYSLIWHRHGYLSTGLVHDLVNELTEGKKVIFGPKAMFCSNMLQKQKAEHALMQCPDIHAAKISLVRKVEKRAPFHESSAIHNNL